VNIRPLEIERFTLKAMKESLSSVVIRRKSPMTFACSTVKVNESKSNHDSFKFKSILVEQDKSS
jgi:hypothetical protein